MKFSNLHPWGVTPTQATKIQKELRRRILLEPIRRRVKYLAGADVSYSRRSKRTWAGIITLKYPTLEKIEETWVKGESTFPYISGLLSFREVPLLLKALKNARIAPDLLVCDGQGIAHPRGMGLAAHLGLLTGTPSIGCAKTRLIGEFDEPGPSKGDHTPLLYHDKRIGAVLRTRTGVKPVFVSPGYAVTIDESVEWVLACTGKYRLPEPTRLAHALVTRIRREEETL
jgi:deoxyribonuclease V